MRWARLALAWVCAGAGFEVQGRLMDHALDVLVAHWAWLAWLQ